MRFLHGGSHCITALREEASNEVSYTKKLTTKIIVSEKWEQLTTFEINVKTNTNITYIYIYIR